MFLNYQYERSSERIGNFRGFRQFLIFCSTFTTATLSFSEKKHENVQEMAGNLIF